MAKKNYARKTFRKVTHSIGRAIKKRYTKKGNWYKGLAPNFKRIESDVMRLKSLVNVEKKFYEVAWAEQTLGQCNGNSDGCLAIDITPIPAEGTTQQTRNGASIKLTGGMIRVQFRQMSALHTAMKFRVYVIHTKNQVSTMGTTTNRQFLSPDVITSVVDYNSLRNPDYYGDFRILARRIVTIPADNYSTMTARFKDLQINLKLNSHVRFSGDTTTVVNGQIWLLFVANTGNCSTTTASTLSKIANTAINTGAYADVASRFYYVDN